MARLWAQLQRSRLDSERSLWASVMIWPWSTAYGTPVDGRGARTGQWWRCDSASLSVLICADLQSCLLSENTVNQINSFLQGNMMTLSACRWCDEELKIFFTFPGFSEAVIDWWISNVSNGNYNKYHFCLPIYSKSWRKNQYSVSMTLHKRKEISRGWLCGSEEKNTLSRVNSFCRLMPRW